MSKRAKGKPQHAVAYCFDWGGVSWEAELRYDVLSEPRAATRIDPPDYLEVDVYEVALLAWSDEESRIAIPQGVYMDPSGLPNLDGAEQACVDDWHENHSTEALREARADEERDYGADE